jgi:hypothetical protein
VDINHPPEIRAEAAAKATVAAFAASEGHAHPRVIELPKVIDFLMHLYCILAEFDEQLFIVL